MPSSLNYRVATNHPATNIIGNPTDRVRTRGSFNNLALCAFSAFLSNVEPLSYIDALESPDFVLAMQEELNQFERNDVWDLVPRPKDKLIIGT